MTCCRMPSGKPSGAAAPHLLTRRNCERFGIVTRHLRRAKRETMTFVVSGLLNKQIAVELGISEITVKAHRGQVMRKMQVASLAELVRVAAALDVPLVAHA